MLDLLSFDKTISTDTRDSLELLQHSVVVIQGTFQNEFGFVDLPSPLGTDRVGMMSPAMEWEKKS